MADETQPELSLAGLRRRGARRRSAALVPDARQPGLFGLFSEDLLHDQAESGASISPHLPDAAATNPENGAGHEARQQIRSLPAAQSPVEVRRPPAAPPPVLIARSADELSSPSVISAPETVAVVPSPSALPAETPEPRPGNWTVSGLVRHVRGLVERGYGQVTVEGEISNWRPAGSGHCYFTLKDADAQLSAVMFRRQVSLMRFRPNDGDAVRLHGQLSVYESRGQMQLIVEWMEQVGFGAVLAALQRLKERLRGEGLFARKRPLPPFPRCIGVVTSLQGAALRDIVKVCRRRHAAVQLLIYPAAVQGPNCAAEIAAGLRWFNAHPDRAEVVLVARGGGSWEDLHGFDDEGVVRAIAGCVLPVITGLGHATDSTLADLAADQCAPTPSAAAELLTAAQHRVEEHVDRLDGRLRRAGAFELLRAQQRLARLRPASVLRRVQDGLNRRAQRIDELGFRLAAARISRLRELHARLTQVAARLGRQSSLERLRTDSRRRELLQNRLERAATLHLATLTRRRETATTRLRSLSPLRVLDRGYALVYGPDGHLLRSPTAVEEGQEITARLAGGSLRARVLSHG